MGVKVGPQVYQRMVTLCISKGLYCDLLLLLYHVPMLRLWGGGVGVGGAFEVALVNGCVNPALEFQEARQQ